MVEDEEEDAVAVEEEEGLLRPFSTISRPRLSNSLFDKLDGVVLDFVLDSIAFCCTCHSITQSLPKSLVFTHLVTVTVIFQIRILRSFVAMCKH